MIVALVLFTLAVTLLLLPSLIGDKEQDLSRVEDSLNERLTQLKDEFQFRTKELSRRLKSGDLAEEEWEQLSKELEIDTRNSIDSAQLASQSSKTKKLTLFGFSLVLICVFVSVLSYQQSTSQAAAKNALVVVEKLKSEPSYIDTLSKAVEEKKDRESLEALYLALRLQADNAPEKIENWRALAQFNARVGRIEEANSAMNVALSVASENAASGKKLSENQPSEEVNLLVEQAQILAGAKEKPLREQAKQILARVLKQQPNHQAALATLGFSAFNLGDYHAAIDAWERLLATRDPNSQATQMLEKSIAMAKKKLAGVTQSDNAKDIAAQAKAAQSAKVFVDVKIAPEIASQLSGNEVLYIFAKAAKGPPIPLAVVRTQISEITQTFELSEENAMQPQMTIAQFDEVVISARISRDGVANAKAGDFQGESVTVTKPFSTNPVSIMINETL